MVLLFLTSFNQLLITIDARKTFGQADQTFVLPKKKRIVLSTLIGLIIGAYDGFLGPGAGTFLILVFSSIGFNLVLASGNAKVV